MRFQNSAFATSIALALLSTPGFSQQNPALVRDIDTLKQEITGRGQSYANLAELTSIGPRLSGSTGAARSVDWVMAKMQSYGFDRVWKQPVRVPRWERGNRERAQILTGDQPVDLAVAALGMSPGTSGTEGEVIEVQSLDEVRRLGQTVRGKIVFYNRPMDTSLADTFAAYGGAADQRFSGPGVAAGLGAAAVSCVHFRPFKTMTTRTLVSRIFAVRPRFPQPP